jgi:hypothetical protein
MIKFKCPNCQAELAIGHMAVNPHQPTAPFHFWPRDALGLATAPCERKDLTTIPDGVDLVIDARSAWWRRGADGSWAEIRPQDVPPETFPLDDPHAPCFYRDLSGAGHMTVSVRLLPVTCTEFMSRRREIWVRSGSGDAWRRRDEELLA